MYLDTKSIFKLDEVIKKFEVAFRSFIASSFIAKVPDQASFIIEINDLENSLRTSGFLTSPRYSAKVINIKNKSTDIYKTISSANNAFISKTHPGEVPYVSTIVDIFVLFFHKIFSTNTLLKNFSSSEELLLGVNSYHKLRNTLSHPASNQVLMEESFGVLKFIKKIAEVMDSKYFWYSDRPDLLRLIADLPSLSSAQALKIDNLSRVPLQHKKLLCRDDELVRLSEYIFGRPGYQRVAGSVILYGYGGVGKTALVIEFIYRTLVNIRNSTQESTIDFLLFYSSKEEYLRRMDTTGEIYIDKTDQQISSFDDFHATFCRDLAVNSTNEISEKYKNGIVVIDNIENLSSTDKEKIFSFIRSTPRNIQFIITSRNEEPCEEKIYVEEYRDPTRGQEFINQYLLLEDATSAISPDESLSLLKASKGNTLILIQSINSIIQGASSVSEIVASLEPVKTKDARIVADFMYKNTFDNAIRELEKRGHNIRDLIVIISLYKEAIDLYSIGRLCKIDIGSAGEVCQYLSRCLILIKTGEYFQLNEFANNFIFIKMLPGRIELEKIQSTIFEHKNRIKDRIASLDQKTEGNRKIREMMDDWKPKNYIEKIIIAECFTGYKEYFPAVRRGDKEHCEKLLREFSENEMITDHPYVQYQKAQILSKLRRSGLYRGEREKFDTNIARAYEDCLESIEFNYPHVRQTRSHGAVLMFFGAHLLETNQASRAMRHLEEARSIISEPTSKLFFDLRYYLAKAFQRVWQETNDRNYLTSRNLAIDEIVASKHLPDAKDFHLEKLTRMFGHPPGIDTKKNSADNRKINPIRSKKNNT